MGRARLLRLKRAHKEEVGLGRAKTLAGPEIAMIHESPLDKKDESAWDGRLGLGWVEAGRSGAQRLNRISSLECGYVCA